MKKKAAKLHSEEAWAVIDRTATSLISGTFFAEESLARLCVHWRKDVDMPARAVHVRITELRKGRK